MALVTDPSYLTQGDSKTVSDIVVGSVVGANATLTSTANLPQLANDDYFEIRGHTYANNNGLWKVNVDNPTTSSSHLCSGDESHKLHNPTFRRLQISIWL